MRNSTTYRSGLVESEFVSSGRLDLYNANSKALSGMALSVVASGARGALGVRLPEVGSAVRHPLALDLYTRERLVFSLAGS